MFTYIHKYLIKGFFIITHAAINYDEIKFNLRNIFYINWVLVFNFVLVLIFMRVQPSFST